MWQLLLGFGLVVNYRVLLLLLLLLLLFYFYSFQTVVSTLDRSFLISFQSMLPKYIERVRRQHHLADPNRFEFKQTCPKPVSPIDEICWFLAGMSQSVSKHSLPDPTIALLRGLFIYWNVLECLSLGSFFSFCAIFFAQLFASRRPFGRTLSVHWEIRMKPEYLQFFRV